MRAMETRAFQGRIMQILPIKHHCLWSFLMKFGKQEVSQAELQGWGCGPWPVITQPCHREPVCPNPCYRAQLGLVLTNLTVLQNNSSSKLRLFGRKGSVF